MPKLRAEQFQGLTITDAQISDGKRYDANGNVLEQFDPNRLIDQSKVRSLQHQPNGWISRGIINRVEVLPEWQAEYEGRLFYVNASDELYLGVGTEPWYILISGNTASGWDAELTVRTGFDGMNWNGSIATQFQTISYNFSPDGSDLFVYLNGSLMRKDHDYELVDQRTIRMTRNIEQNDTVTMLVILSNSMLNYATKAWVFDQIQSGGIQHSLDNAYDDGSLISVDNRNVDWRLYPDTKFVISEAVTGIPTAAAHLGTKELRNGHNWQTRWQSFDITTQVGGTISGPHRAFLNSPAVTTAEAATEISEALVSAGVTDVFGYVDGYSVGIQAIAPGADVSFTLASGTNALPIFGLTEGAAVGDDAYSSYQNFGLHVDASTLAGIQANEKFWFKVNGSEYFITTGADATYNQIRSSVDSVLDTAGFTATTEGTGTNQDIRVTRDEAGLSFPTLVENVYFAGQTEITQITISGDSNRSLDEKYFTINSIDSALFGHEKPYYVWYHIDAESEVTSISCTSEDSNVTLADKYFELHDTVEDYFVWFKVETPQTPAYQELGFVGLTESSDSGLTQATQYKFNVALDGQAPQEFTITTAPDIQPTKEITKVTTIADSNQSLSGKYWTIDSQTGPSYYVWYNIDTPAAPEITEITSTADVNQSLSGKKFTISSPTKTYTPWFSMVTDPGLPLLPEITEVTAVADVDQSLSGKYFNIDSAGGSRHYVWYEMMTDPGVVATSETTEVTASANTGNGLSGKYFNISLPSSDHYVWYRSQIAGPVSGAAEKTEIILPYDSNKSLSGTYWTFNTPYNEYYVWYRMEVVASQPATAQETTVTFTSQVAADYYGQKFRIYNFGDAYDFVLTDGNTFDPSGYSNPMPINVSTAASASEIALIVRDAIDNTVPFGSASSGDSVILTNNNVGAQTQPPAGDSDIGVAVTQTGTDYVPGEFSTNPSPAGKTGVQVNILENDTNTDVASKTSAQLSLLFDISINLTGAVVTITNNDNGAVQNAADYNAGIVANMITEGVTTQPAQYSPDPAPVGRSGIVIDIGVADDAETVAQKTTDVLNVISGFSVVANTSTLTITSTDTGAVQNATAGTSGFGINITQQGLDYVAPTYSTNPAPAGRSGIKVQIAEDDSAITVAEATRATIDATTFFTATRANAVITITDLTSGAVDDAYDVNTTFTIVTDQQGQDYVAPTYTTPPTGTNLIKVDIVENATDVTVAQALQAKLDETESAFFVVRNGAVLTITNNVPGVASDAGDISTGFTFTTVQDGYEAYSSTNPLVPTKAGMKVTILKNDSANAVAAKTATVVNANPNFMAAASGDEVTVTDNNGGAVADATVGNSNFFVNITQGVDLIPADVSWSQIVTLLNVATTSAAVWTITGGDVRLTGDNIGSWRRVVLSSGSTNDLFASLVGFTGVESAVDGTSSYSAQPAGTGTPISVPIIVGASASAVALATKNAIDAIAEFDATVLSNNITVTNINAGSVADITNHGTGFGFTVVNQGADESAQPSVPGKTSIRINISKNDDANTVAQKTATAVDVGGEFYVTRLNNIISIQNDFPGDVSVTADVDTGFVFTTTGDGQDVKYSLFGDNGLRTTLQSPVAGINATPADVGVGNVALDGGYNFYTFPKDFAVIINGEPLAEIFLNQASYNSSEIVSHINSRILAAGINNLEAYQASGRIGLRTKGIGKTQSLSIKNSLSDALATFGWTPGTYTGDFGSADSILAISALTGQNEVLVNANIMPSSYGTHNIGSETAKFKEIWAQDAHFDAGTIYIGDAAISQETNEFKFTVDNGTDQFDFFGNNDSSIAPTGASRIGVDGVIGIVPEKAGAQSGDPATLQEMLIGITKSTGGSKVFPDMSSTSSSYGDTANLHGFLVEKANGLYLREDEIIYVKSLGRSIIVKQIGVGTVQGVDWEFVDSNQLPVGGKSVKYDLTELDASGNKVAGAIANDSFHVKTAGGIVLETAADKEVTVSNDLRVMGDLYVDGDTVSLSTATLEVEDNIIVLNKNWTGAPNLNAGLEIERGTSTNSRLMWDEGSDLWRSGLSGTEQAIALRNDTQTSGGIAVWNNSTLAFDTTSVAADEYIQDVIGNMVSSNTESGIGVTYDDTSGKLNFDVADPTITLTGDVSGSATMTNLGNVSITTTVADNSHTHDNTTLTSIDWSKVLNKPDPVITLAGDATGTGTMTDVGDVSITVTVVDDSHTHDTRYYTESESDTRFVNTTGDTMSGDLSVVKSNAWITIDSPSAGTDGIDQAAGISIGESGYKGGAAIHVTYTGDGYGHIGMGDVSAATSLPTYEAMRLFYTDNNVTFYGNISGASNKEINGFGKVYNAVWNDIADFITVEKECVVEYGKCYFMTPDLRHIQTTEVCQKGVLGIASDTYGYGLGKVNGTNQLPVAVGGFVLAYIVGDAVPGDVLTCGPEGKLVIMSDEMKARYPERIVATYYKPEIAAEYHGIKVNGRHWVKVK